MKWTVLTDNRTQNAQLETEHGLAIFLETERYKLLLDTGATDVVLRNAERMGIDLSTLDYIFLSHGHADHAGGLRYLMQINQQAKVIASPLALNGQFYSKRGTLHSITATWPEIPAERLLLIDHTSEIGEGLRIIASIPQTHPLPQGNKHLFIKNKEGDYVPDTFGHELALYADGLLFTGCAHSGLENILEACPWPIHTVLGGFHLLDGHESVEELTALGTRLTTSYPNVQFYTSHCTGDAVFASLKKVMGEQLHPFCCGTTQECPA